VVPVLGLTDPGLQSLRRASRVAIVVPAVFALFLNGSDNPVAALFAGFGSFALLGFADFGGAARSRGSAYLVLTAVGAVLVLVGTLVSNEPVAGAVIGVLVATAARFAGCFGGYFAASVSPVILAYVLAASVPSPVDATPDRLLGWIVAGLLSTLASLVLWPRRERLMVREAAAAAAGVLADAVETLGDPAGPPAATLAAVDVAVTALDATASVPRRPAGPSAHDAALAFLLDQLERVAWLVRTAPSRPSVPDRTAELVSVAATALRGVATMLRTGRVVADLDRLVASCLDTKRTVIEHAVEELGRGDAPGAVLEEIDELVTERLALLLAASALANASVLVSGRGPSDDAVTIPLEVPAMAGSTWTRLRALLEANAVPASAWAQESLRAGVAVGAAILIAGELQLDHGFWVVLGTLSVLRSNAFATGRSALMASAGTAIGFALSAGLLALVGFDQTGLWIIVVVGFFLSAYTPQVVGFVAGQVCFTIAVVAMFNLIEPQGWHTGLVRFENIVIGSSVSAIVALLFWPRRASVGLRTNLVELYRGLGRALPAGIAHREWMLPVHRAELRAHASYVQYLSETARVPAGRRPWATLLAEAAQTRFAIEMLERHRGLTRFDQCGPTRTALHECAAEIARTLDGTAARLESRDRPANGRVDVESAARSTRDPVTACLGHHAHDAGPDSPLAAGLDAALVRDLLLEVAAIADHALETAPTVPDG
jgi:uncharacterized membrane protein YccC